MKEQQLKLEDRLKELESMVEQLESGKLSIDESVKVYEAGMALAKDLEKQLTSLESRILVASGEEEVPFDAQ
ncbi:MAG: exodeoxyribonuclease VII small subunit [Clostridiales bacterium]|nr:exodeoxyribonuclease VII small subunit [Clostridiales bacterium]